MVDSGETVSLSGVTIEDAADNGGDAGGIWNLGTLTVSGSIFTDNSAFFGGGIENDGTATVSDSTFASNSCRLWWRHLQQRWNGDDK